MRKAKLSRQEKKHCEFLEKDVIPRMTIEFVKTEVKPVYSKMVNGRLYLYEKF